jgi:molybdopterin synthase sulfur carrier subunit
MKLKVIFFAQLKDQLGIDKIDVDFQNVRNVSDLKIALEKNYEGCEECFRTVTVLGVAVNHEYGTFDTLLNEGDEVAFFPPVTGG